MKYGIFNNHVKTTQHGTHDQRLSAFLSAMYPKVETNTEFREVKDEPNVKSSKVL